jgi:molecular chaperone GrpE
MENENLTGDPVSAGADVSDLLALTAERDQLAAERAELQDRLLRKLAEFDNFRKRTERELADRSEYAVADTVTTLLPILDDFERALQHETTDKEYARGVELIYSRLFEALRKLGVEPIEAVGQPFDYNIHNAIEMVPSEEAEDHTVLADLQRGYMFKGRLLRPSMVRVAVKPS